MQKLPIHDVIPEILSQLQSAHRLILQAPPGAGKTTAVPLALLKTSWLGDKQIIMLEPRRLAARSSAMRMAYLLNEKVGQRVGYQIKADRCVSRETKIIVVTEGILTRMLQSDPALENVAMIIFDEFHERNLHGDLALALTLQSQELLREDLKLMVMSATLNTDALSELLEHPPLITAQGRSFPVQNIYLNAKQSHPSLRELPALVTQTVLKILQDDHGSILVFLPGVKEIKNVEKRLRESVDEKQCIIAPLYGEMSKEAQDAAINPTETKRRKVVLATNIAETSLTIEGITVVVDTGLQRVSTFNSASGMNRLTTTTISQDSATQRSGRAGRLSAGTCYRLWHEHKILQKHTIPEILTSDLSPMILELAQWGVDDVSELQWLDLPKESAADHARDLLQQLGALKGRSITTHGKEMLALGTHPRLAHMILKAQDLGLSQHACIVAALLSEKEIFRGAHRQNVDLSLRVSAIKEREDGAHIDRSAFYRVVESTKAFEKKLTSQKQQHHHDAIALLLAFAYPDRIAKCRHLNDTRYLLSNNKGAKLHPEAELFGAPYLVVAQLDGGGQDAQIYRAATIDEATLYTHLNTSIVTKEEVRWNSKMQRVEAREVTALGALILKEKHIQQPSSQALSSALLIAVKEVGLEALSWSKEAMNLRHRVNFLNHHKDATPQTETAIGTLPDFSEQYLHEHLEDWLAPHLEGVSSFKALQKLNTHTLLLSLLTWEQQERIKTLAPIKYKVPSGSRITLNYSDPTAPTLSVRLQELFGLTETPALIHNHVPLTIELLSPAKRPMQVTKDLKSFWDNTYSEVKKELRGKYKKHYWPDDPYQAVATSKTKKHM